MATSAWAALVAGALLTSCLSVQASPSSPPTFAASAASPVVNPWIAEEIDPAPGPTVTGGIAAALDGPAEDVVAAVFGLRHPAGNGAWVWVFRAGDLTSEVALERWAANEPRCDGTVDRGMLSGRKTLIIRRQFLDQCQPQYLVQIDDRTAAIITDDGAYQGNASDQPTVPYRSAAEVEWIVSWLQEQLKTVELQPGGPPFTQG